MEVVNQRDIQQPATLLLPGGNRCACVINAIAVDGVELIISDTAAPTLDKHDRLKLQVERSGNLLSVELLLASQQGSALKLRYVDSNSPAARQLYRWFSPAPAAGLPAASGEILRELEELAIPYLGNLLDNFLDHTDQKLLELAEAASSNQEQNQLFEVKSELRQYQQEISQLCCNQLRSRIRQPDAELPALQAAEEAQHDTMELVNLTEFEDWLSLEVIVRRAKERYFTPLSCLQRRLSQATGQALSEEQLPVGPAAISATLQSTLRNYTIPHQVLPYVYRFFEDAVINHLGELFDALNAKLKARGILPNVESQILREAGRLRPTPVASQPSASAPQPPAPEAPGPGGPAVVAHNNVALFNTAKSLMELVASAPQQLAEQAMAQPIPRQTLVQELGQFQADPNLAASLPAEMSLLGWLQQHLSAPLSQELFEVIQLVDCVFKAASEQSELPESQSDMLQKLRLPIAKLAVMDSSFFTSAQHPGRLLLNRLIELCVNTELPNRPFESKVNAIVQDISQQFDQDIGIFSSALEELNSIATQQYNASGRNTQRVVQTYEGRQRVLQAQREVDREIQRRVSPPQAPAVVVELLDNGWRELLKLTYIKMGSDSEDWQTYLNILDELLVWIDEYTGENEHANHPAIETEADSFADLITQELNNIFPGDYHYQETVEHIRDTLKGKRPVTMVEIKGDSVTTVKSPNELRNELKAANPDLSRWFKRAQNLKVGDEFTYLDDETGHRNLKLAWISENQQHFVFVNRRGQKVFDFDLVDVANELSRGLTPSKQQNDWPLVERSLYATVQQTYQKLAERSSHDDLTGLINRKECERLLTRVLNSAKNELQHHCLLYLDVDNFGLTNNLLGHVAGDQLLQDMVQALLTQMPDNATVGRIAGNEFIVLLENSDEQQGVIAANRLLKHLEEQVFNWQEHSVQLTASIGVIVINKYTSNVVDLIRNAVSACSTAKSNGGNRASSFRQDAAMHARREELLYWINNLNQILSGDRLALRAQKIIPLGDQSEAPDNHYEVLLGIRNDSGELESPVEFIEAAECYHRMQRVDRWVVENTFAWMRSLEEQGHAIPSVSINLSGNSLNDEQFLEFILDQFARYKVPTALVCFEVTETATINNLAWAADFIKEIKRIGCHFSLDDFGSGNASYQYLKHLPVDYLKIDGLFVREIHQNKNDYALVKSINDIAHLMGKKTIAEYAENDQVIEVLREIGVDYAQGWGVDKPVPFDQLSFQTH